jgi:hypothetical protein
MFPQDPWQHADAERALGMGLAEIPAISTAPATAAGFHLYFIKKKSRVNSFQQKQLVRPGIWNSALRNSIFSKNSC